MLGLLATSVLRSPNPVGSVHADGQKIHPGAASAEHAAQTAPRQPSAATRARLVVRVHDGHRPIRGAELTVRTADGLYAGRTNARGRARIVLERSGMATVNATAPGYVAQMTTVDVRDRSARAELRLQAGAVLRGSVVGYAGAPARLSVVALAERGEGGMATGPVAADGRFALTALEPGTYAVGLNPGSYHAQAVLVHLEAGEEAEIELPMVALGTLTVTARFPDGGSYRSELRLEREADGARLERVVRLASGVAQEVEAVPAGRYAVELAVEGAAKRPDQIAVVVPGQPTAVVFTWPSGELLGRVVDARGAIAGAGVAAFKVTVNEEGREIRSSHPDHATETDGFGRYVFRGLDPGRYAIGALSVGKMGLGAVEVAEGERRELELRLAEVVSLRTRVEYRGVPVAGARVFATSVPVSLNARSAGTDASGVASVPSLTPGSYRIHAVWNDGDDGALREGRAEVMVTGERDQAVTLQLH
jgi:hypothetical protein